MRRDQTGVMVLITDRGTPAKSGSITDVMFGVHRPLLHVEHFQEGLANLRQPWAPVRVKSREVLHREVCAPRPSVMPARRFMESSVNFPR
jgi:hypothetical protein